MGVCRAASETAVKEAWPTWRQASTIVGTEWLVVSPSLQVYRGRRDSEGMRSG